MIPILLGIAMGMSTGGSPLGAIFYIIVWNLFAYFEMRFMYYKGYQLGGKAVDFLVGPQGEALRESITMLGGIVIGAVSATWVGVTTSFELKMQLSALKKINQWKNLAIAISTLGVAIAYYNAFIICRIFLDILLCLGISYLAGVS